MRLSTYPSPSSHVQMRCQRRLNVGVKMIQIAPGFINILQFDCITARYDGKHDRKTLLSTPGSVIKSQHPEPIDNSRPSLRLVVSPGKGRCERATVVTEAVDRRRPEARSVMKPLSIRPPLSCSADVIPPPCIVNTEPARLPHPLFSIAENT